jgi:carbon monoxide dehydrogenase subunit G
MTVWEEGARMTTVSRSQTVPATPERAWSVLSSSAALWSLFPGTFGLALDVPAAAGRLCLVIRVKGSSVGAGVVDVRENLAERVISLHGPIPGGPEELTLAVSSARDGAKVVIRASGDVPLAARWDKRTVWGNVLETWLIGCRALLDGCRPWPGPEIPASVRAVCTRWRILDDLVSFPATTLIDAPVAQVWDTVWDPATTLRTTPQCVAAGRVPGTPAMRPGEMQYYIVPRRNRGLHAHLLVVHGIDEGRSAVVQAITPRHAEIRYLLEPEAGGTRLTLTSLYPRRIVKDHDVVSRSVAELAASYKNLLEQPARPGHPRPS